MTQVRSLPRRTTAVAPPGAMPSAERRSIPRFTCSLSCTCTPITLSCTAPQLPGRIDVLATHGLALTLNRPLMPGMFLHIQLRRRQATTRLRVKVVRCKMQANRREWTVACMCVPVLTEADLYNLL